jgi:ATPase subunit of ABC transporter with duplicated ATPase domains
LSVDPNVLLLDEPTNHLDRRNRTSLMRMLHAYSGTLIVVSHDTELLRNCINTLWHIDYGKIHIFSGNYDDYMQEMRLKRASLEEDLARLHRQKREIYDQRMREQQRVAKSRACGEKKVENRKWLKAVGDLKGMKAEKSQGKKLSRIDETRNELTQRLAELRLPEIIVPQFSIDSHEYNRRTLVQISGGSIGYGLEQPILSGISLTVTGQDRIAITGENGSGKSTLIRAILNDEAVYRIGDWYVIQKDNIGYLDQHYGTLDPDKSVLEILSECVPSWSHAEIRRHLNDFLFRKNEEVNASVMTLSGGEKARLSLACIAAKTPRLLILDEVTNNLDLETRAHVVQVLKDYPGAMLIISHDADFLEDIGMNTVVDVGRFR